MTVKDLKVAKPSAILYFEAWFVAKVGSITKITCLQLSKFIRAVLLDSVSPAATDSSDEWESTDQGELSC